MLEQPLNASISIELMLAFCNNVGLLCKHNFNRNDAMTDSNDPKGRSKGGRARADKLTADQRSEIAKKGAAARWHGEAKQKTNILLAASESVGAPNAMYWGVLPIGDMQLDCVVLDNGMRVLTATSIFQAFGRSRKGMNSRLEIEGTKLPPFLAAKNLEPFISQLVIDRTNLVRYLDGKQEKTGYIATLLPSMCEVYLSARRNEALVSSQLKLAEQSEILLSALAHVGIDALVDEATGYQLDRRHDALRILLSKYISEGLQRWILTFPDSFFVELDKLYGNEHTTSRNRPQYYGHFINKYIYDPIENGYVKNKLNELNIGEDGKRKARFHQWLSSDGKNILVHQIGRVQGKMEDCTGIKQFKARQEKQKIISIAPYLFDEMNQIE